MPAEAVKGQRNGAKKEQAIFPGDCAYKERAQIERRTKEMATTGASKTPSPEGIFQMLNAYQQTAVLRAAIELDLFSAIGEGASTAEAIASKVSAKTRGVRILCDALCIAGLLTKNGVAYGLSVDAATFLDRKSPACVAGIAGFLGRSELVKNFSVLAETVRRGAPPADTVAEPENPIWVSFARSMAPMTVPAANFIAALLGAQSGQPMKVLDIAAGHGNFGITIAKLNPQACVVAQDWAAVLTVALENAQKASVDTRVQVLPGSAFEVAFGEGYDAVLLTNFLHHFDTGTNEALLKKIHAALKPGGKVVTLEFVPNEDRVSPAVPALFSVAMLASTATGDAYTYSEYDGMFKNAGYAKTTAHPVPGMPQTVLLSEKQL
jgi:2-polyprenyl-3-methyl-5-hydroxy-6-metoxy-1,4-benzoquinol methylase